MTNHNQAPKPVSESQAQTPVDLLHKQFQEGAPSRRVQRGEPLIADELSAEDLDDLVLAVLKRSKDSSSYKFDYAEGDYESEHYTVGAVIRRSEDEGNERHFVTQIRMGYKTDDGEWAVNPRLAYHISSRWMSNPIGMRKPDSVKVS